MFVCLVIFECIKEVFIVVKVNFGDNGVFMLVLFFLRVLVECYEIFC